MKSKRACLVINPHAGQNVARLTELIWSVDITSSHMIQFVRDRKSYSFAILRCANQQTKEGSS